VLRVDLANGRNEGVPISEQFAREHIGGPGFGAALPADPPARVTAPRGAADRLIFAPGPLTGLPLPGAARCHVMVLSPDTGRIAGGSIGGDLGPAIRRAGYDAVVIVGRAPDPCFLEIAESEVRIGPAARLLGLSAAAARERVREEPGCAEAAVAAIGPAGEKEDPGAIISSGGHHCAGGMGAVMGSKNLKAIAVSGSKPVPVADPARLAALAERLSGRGSPLPCPADCEAECVYKRGGPAPMADELGVDMIRPACRKLATPEMMLLDLLGLCYQPWLDIEGGIELAVECYRAATGAEQGTAALLEVARAVQGAMTR
jgi:aldehyde:ferredoxin oxidoreductase